MAGDKTYITDGQGKLHRATRVHAVTPTDIVWSSNPNDYTVQVKIDGKWHRAVLTMDAGSSTFFDNINIDKALVTGADGKQHTALIVKPESTVTLSDIKTDTHGTIAGTTTGETAVSTYSENWSDIKWQDNVNVYKVLVTGSDGKVHTALLTTSVGGGVQVIVLGPSPLNLPDAIANSLSYVKAFGGTEQRDIPDNYLQRQYIYMLDNSRIQVEDLPISAGYRVEFDFQTLTLSSALRNYIGGRVAGVSAGGGFRLSKLASGGTTLNRVVLCGFESGTEYYDPTEQFQANTRYKYTYDNGVCTLESGGSVVSTQTFTVTDNTSTNWGINTYAAGTSYTTNSDGIYVYSVKVWNEQGELVMNLVPAVQKGAVTVVGFYDTVTGGFRTPTAGTFAAGPEAVPSPDTPINIMSNNGVLRIQGSATGTGTQAGDPTPTEPIYPVFYQKGDLVLRAVDGYADTYDATTQIITRNIGVHIFDGTENFTALSTPNTFRFSFVVPDRGAAANPMCSHYPAATITLTTANMPDKTIKGNSTAANNYYIKDLRFSTEDELKAWLAAQYTAGTPVIIYYALETPMTESFTPSVYADGTVETIGIRTRNLYDANSNKAFVEENTQYTVSLIKTASRVNIAAYDTNDTSLRVVATWSSAQTGAQQTTFTTPENTKYIACASSLDLVSNVQIEKGSTATDYAPYYDGGTATAEMLLKVGDYQDVQSILDGVVTRKVGIKVLDGTENWVFSTAWLNYMYSLEVSDLYAEASSVASNRKSPYCTHFGRSENWLGGSARANMVQAYQPTTGDAILGLGYGTPSTANLVAFKQWLADQYAAGTPVIIVYPLATPTTESVAGQALQVTGGDNVLEITQASLTGLELEAQYSAAVSLTIQEVQDANLDNNVTVTIQ